MGKGFQREPLNHCPTFRPYSRPNKAAIFIFLKINAYRLTPDKPLVVCSYQSSMATVENKTPCPIEGRNGTDEMAKKSPKTEAAEVKTEAPIITNEATASKPLPTVEDVAAMFASQPLPRVIKSLVADYSASLFSGMIEAARKQRESKAITGAALEALDTAIEQLTEADKGSNDALYALIAAAIRQAAGAEIPLAESEAKSGKGKASKGGGGKRLTAEMYAELAPKALAFAKSKAEGINRGELAEALGCEPSRAASIIKKMSEAKQLKSNGEERSKARYLAA